MITGAPPRGMDAPVKRATMRIELLAIAGLIVLIVVLTIIGRT